MQTVCEQKLFGANGKNTGFVPQSVVELEMDPAEVKLSIQVFTAGLVVSGLILLGVHALGL